MLPLLPKATAAVAVLFAMWHNNVGVFAEEEQSCKVVDLGMNYSQEDAPQDISIVESTILDKVNKVIDNLLSVSILYSGSDVQGKEIGERKIKALIERVVGSKVRHECLLVVYSVHDTDECTTTNPAWKHQCHSSAECVNTMGSYECQCPAGTFGSLESGVNGGSGGKGRFLFGSKRPSAPGTCWGHPNTTACCKHGLRERCDVDSCVKTCMSTFECVSDPCTPAVASKFCPSETTCVPREGGRSEMWSPDADFAAADLRGGFECLSDVCANHDCPCNCRCVRQSEKGYTCEPEPGYRKHPFDEPGSKQNKSSLRLDSGSCISEQPPRMTIRGDRVVKLKQGDDYKERGAEIDDPGISKSLTRRIRVSYPDGPLGSCLSTVGAFKVNYQLEDWSSLPYEEEASEDEQQKLPVWDSQNRTVVVSDVDECAYTGACDQFAAKCVPAALCVNTIGSYTCECLGGYDGDGRTDGRGCADTRPPVIECQGAGCLPKVFRAADIRGLVSADRQYEYLSDTSDLTFVKTKIQEIFDEGRALGTDLFCETARLGRPCFVAYDMVFSPEDGSESKVVLTPNITMLKLEVPTEEELLESGAFHMKSSALSFVVTYSVGDAAYNFATAQRHVKVTAFSNDMLAQLTSERIGFVVKRVLVAAGLALALFAASVWIWTLRASLVSFVLIAPFTVAYLVLPPQTFGRLADRKQFVGAVDAWLYVSRLGLLDEHERLTRALQEYSDLQNMED